MIRRGILILTVLLLFASALGLVTAQHRTRSLFIDLERAQQEAKRLDVDYERLKIELARLSQPAAVERAVHLSHEKYCSASAMLGKTAAMTVTHEIVEDA